MSLRISDKTIRQFITDVGDAHYAMAGAVIAAGAAQAAALGEACMQLSLENQVDKLDWASVSGRIEQMVHLKQTLIEWCDQDAKAMAELIDPAVIADELEQRRSLCESPAEIARLAIEAAAMLQDFRPHVFAQVQDDLEMALALLAGAGQAASMLLDSNLRIWSSEPALLREFEPVLTELEQQLEQLRPLKRIRNSTGEKR
jgi:formiminotetrahydrofolate cyclodeaminase